jgi:deazaflavin-dependent oxidoreductase (nitroreductase family)
MTNNARPAPGKIQKRFARMPLYLYRFGLGSLFGESLLVITHRGRRSGKLFQTPVEVVSHDADSHEYFVWSGRGQRSNWYRNLVAEPAVAIQVGRRRWIPQQRFVSPEEAAERFAAYARRRPRAAQRLRESVLENTAEATDAAMAEALPMVAFSDRGPEAK